MKTQLIKINIVMLVLLIEVVSVNIIGAVMGQKADEAETAGIAGE